MSYIASPAPPSTETAITTTTVTKPTTLVKYDAACQAVAELKSVDEAKELRDEAMAMQVYARQAENKQLEADAAAIRMRAERRLGQLMKQQRATVGLNKGGRPVKPKTGFSKNPVSEKPTLASQNVSKNLAHKARTLSAMPEPEFNEAVENKRESVSHRKPAAKKKGTSAKDIALSDFSARVMELLRLTRGQKPTRFAGTAVKANDLAKLGKFLTDLAKIETEEPAL
jgi:hypothetical protein